MVVVTGGLLLMVVVIGWTVVNGARTHLDAKKRTCEL